MWCYHEKYISIIYFNDIVISFNHVLLSFFKIKTMMFKKWYQIRFFRLSKKYQTNLSNKVHYNWCLRIHNKILMLQKKQMRYKKFLSFSDFIYYSLSLFDGLHAHIKSFLISSKFIVFWTIEKKQSSQKNCKSKVLRGN